MFTIDNIAVLNSLLGKKLQAISTSYGALYSDMLRADKIDITFHFENFYMVFFCDYEQKKFFENDSGDVYYDFFIEKRKSQPGYEHIRKFNLWIIEKIEIFSRKLEVEDFKNYTSLFNRIKSFDRTEDMFIFSFSNGKRALMTFHPFMTGLEVIFEEFAIQKFLKEYGGTYKLSEKLTLKD
jgi:hypothetical protein